MTIVSLIAVTCWLAATAVNLAGYRSWKRYRQRDRDAARTAGLVVVQLLLRSRAWLECDRCGGRLDTDAGPDRPATLELDDLEQLRMLCPSCTAWRDTGCP